MLVTRLSFPPTLDTIANTIHLIAILPTLCIPYVQRRLTNLGSSRRFHPLLLPANSSLLPHHASLFHTLFQLSVIANLSLLNLPIVVPTLPLLVPLPCRNDPVDFFADVFGRHFGLGKQVQAIVLFISQIAPLVLGEVGLGFLGVCEAESR